MYREYERYDSVLCSLMWFKYIKWKSSGLYNGTVLQAFLVEAVSVIHTQVEVAIESISTDDEQVLYYIGGGIIRKLTKQAKSDEKDILMTFWETTGVKGGETFARWTEKKWLWWYWNVLPLPKFPFVSNHSGRRTL